MKAAPIKIGDTVKHSTVFIRSLGGAGGWRAEVRGRVMEIYHGPDDWTLALVEWEKGNGWSELNVKNLVTIERVYAEARKAETDRVPGIVIGSNAFAQ